MPYKTGKIYYGWFMLIGVMTVYLTFGGIFISSFGVLLPVITKELGWSRAEVSLAMSFGVLAFGLPSPFFGVIIGRLGSKIAIITGNIVGGLSITAVFFIGEVWHLYVIYIIAGIGGGFGGFIACSTLINNWFIRKRSLALGMFTTCMGLGGFIFPPLTTVLILSFGWRFAWLIFGMMVLGIGVPLAGFLIHNRPEDIGLLPDGDPIQTALQEQKGGIRPSKGQETGNSPGTIMQLLNDKTVWFISLMAVANSFSVGTMATHQIAYLRDIGYDPITSATTLSFMSLFCIIGSLAFGMVAMRMNVRYMAVSAFGLQAAGLIIILATRELSLVYVYSAFQGISQGSLLTALPTLVGGYYQRRCYSRVIGVILPFQYVSNAVAATVAGALFDATGAYSAAFMIALSCSISGILFAFLARSPRQVAHVGDMSL